MTNYNGFKEIIGYVDQRLDNVMKFCKAIGITYAEFQRREYFGLIPQSVLNVLHNNKEVSPAYIEKHYEALKNGRRY